LTLTYGTRNDFGFCATNDQTCLSQHADGVPFDIEAGRSFAVPGATLDNILSDWRVYANIRSVHLFPTSYTPPFTAFLQRFKSITHATISIRHAGVGNGSGSTLTSDLRFQVAIPASIYPENAVVGRLTNSAIPMLPSTPEAGVRTTDVLDVT